MLERMDWRSDSWMAGVPAPEPAPPGAGAGTGTVAGVLLEVVLGLLSAGCLDLVLPVPTNNTKCKICLLLQYLQ